MIRYFPSTVLVSDKLPNQNSLKKCKAIFNSKNVHVCAYHFHFQYILQFHYYSCAMFGWGFESTRYAWTFEKHWLMDSVLEFKYFSNCAYVEYIMYMYIFVQKTYYTKIIFFQNIVCKYSWQLKTFYVAFVPAATESLWSVSNQQVGWSSLFCKLYFRQQNVQPTDAQRQAVCNGITVTMWVLNRWKNRSSYFLRRPYSSRTRYI